MLTYQILGEPHPAMRVDVEADPDAMQCFARQMNVMPSRWSLIHHAFLYRVDIGPGGIGWSCQTNVFAAIGEACETLVSDALVLCPSIGTGVAEATMVHVPAVQARAASQRRVPDKYRESTHCPVMVHQGK